MARLILNPGTDDTQAFDLQPGTHSVGRRPDNDICIPDASVSGQHCSLIITSDSVTLRDLDSTNGTFVDEKPVTEMLLHHGQNLRFGSMTLRFEQEDGAMPQAPPPPAPSHPPRVRVRVKAGQAGTDADQTLILKREPPSILKAVPAAPRKGTTHKPLAGKKQPKPMQQRGFGEPNIGMGILGAAAGAFLGTMLWFGMIQLTGFEFGIIAWGVGLATGFGCRILGGGYSTLLGFVAAALTFVAVLGGQYLAGRAAVNDLFDEMSGEFYDEAVASAQEVVSLETDEALRSYLVDDLSYEVSMDEIVTDDELAAFRRDELPELQALASRTTTKAEFTKQMKDEFFSVGMTVLIFKESLSLFTLLWLFLGIGSAWRLGIGEDAQ